MFVVGVSTSVDGSAPGIFLSAEKVDSNPPDIGFLVQNETGQFGEKGVTHLKVRFDKLNLVASSSLVKIPVAGQYAVDNLLLRRSGSTLTRSVSVAPGYFLDTYKKNDYGGYFTETRAVSSCDGPNGYLFTETHNRWRDGMDDLNQVYYTYVLTGSMIFEEARLYRHWTSSSGSVILHYDYTATRSFYPEVSGDISVNDIGDLASAISLSTALDAVCVTNSNFSRQLPEALDEVSLKAVSNMKTLDQSSSLLLKESAQIFSEYKSVAKLLSNPLDPKTWADAYLMNKWGAKQTMRDLEATSLKLSKAYKRAQAAEKFESLTSYGAHSLNANGPYGQIGVQLRCKVRYTPQPGYLTGFVRRSKELGFWPTYSQIADFVPFSFMANWFSNYGDILDKADNLSYLESQQVLGCVYSDKRTITVDLGVFSPSWKDSGQAIITFYRRYTTGTLLVTGDVRFDLERPSAINILDGGALLSQRLFGR